MSLFGSSFAQPKPTLSLFGNSTQNQPQAQPSTNMFGSTAASQAPRPSLSLFTASTNTTSQPATTSLFGAANPQPQPVQGGASTSLFANNSNTASRPSLFGSNMGTAQPAQPAQPAAGGSLFGPSFAQPQQQQQQAPAQPAAGGSLFGPSFAQSTQSQLQQQQQQQAQAQQGSLLGMSAGNLNASVGQASIWNPGSLQPREKSIPDQMSTLFEKWNPVSPSCAFQHYFYNHVPEEQVPYYAPSPGEDGAKWEEALKKKPGPGAIPVLARGPLSVGRRLETQAVWVRGIQSRLHELNQVLTKRLQEHDLQYSVRAAEARRKHVVLSRRCLSLATKVQILRNRGYAMDGAEEALKVKLQNLEKLAFDPMVSGRQEEIWARMSVLRERAQLLKTETDKLAKDVAVSGGDGPLAEAQMKKVEKILSSYEMQLGQLKKERESAEKDFDEWKAATQTGVAVGR